MKNTASQIKLNRTGAGVSSPSSGVRPGARALNLELPTSFGFRIFMGALCLLAGSFLFSHSAYAASYLNVSSSGSVSFGSIRPTSSGTSSTGSDTLTVHTDCSTGYSVYVSGQNGKDTNLTNSSASSDNTISTSSNAIGSAGSLGSNTWGLNYENTGAYVGLPTYDDALTAALTTKSNIEESSTVDIYYGIKVNTAITPGTYTGDVLYTVLMDSSCLAYTVTFDANGGSGSMDNQSIMAGTKTALDENTFTRSGYTFLGWSTKANGRTETAVDGVGMEADVDYSDKAEVTDLTSGGSSITLYAIWKENDHWTINYSSNGADSGSPSKTTEGTVYSGSVTMPAVGTMVKSSYEFKGWALTSDATTATYQAEETVSLSALLTAASSAGQTTISGSIITLYPVWEALPTAMQDFICSSLTGGTSTTLRDARDNQRYSVYRFPTDIKYAGTSTVANVAGKCIMTKDLNLGAVASVSGASSTIEANGKMTLSPVDSGFTEPTGTDYEGIAVPTASQTITNGTGSWGNGDSSTNTYSNRKYTASGTDDYAGRGYYTWGAAMLACPKNWRLLTADEYSIDSGNWESQTGGLATIVKGSNYTVTLNNIKSSPYSFVLSGNYYGGFANAPSNGFYWSSTQYSSTDSYHLYLNSSNGLVRGIRNKYLGFAVRCIADPPTTYTYTLSYSGADFATANKPETQTYTGYETSHTFMLPGAKPTYSTTGTTITFSNYTYNGTTYNPGSTITLSSSSPSATVTANWTRSCTISSSTGCKLADNKTWIYGNSGNTVTWNSLCTSSDNCKASTYCPSGYQNIPTRAIYNTLVGSYGNGGALYRVLGLSGFRFFWSSTENAGGTSNAFLLDVYSSNTGVGSSHKANSVYILCYK